MPEWTTWKRRLWSLTPSTEMIRYKNQLSCVCFSGLSHLLYGQWLCEDVDGGSEEAWQLVVAATDALIIHFRDGALIAVTVMIKPLGHVIHQRQERREEWVISNAHTHTWQHSHIQFQRRAEAAHAANTQQTRWQVSRPPVFDCGTTFHPDYRPSDWPSTPSDNFWNPTEVLVRYWSLTSLNITHAIGSWYMWVVRGEMEWIRAFHNTGRPHNSILRSTYSGHVRSGSLDS